MTGLVCFNLAIHDRGIMTDRAIEVTVKNNLRWNGTSVRFPKTSLIPIIPSTLMPFVPLTHLIRFTGTASANSSLSTWTVSTE